MSAWSPLLRRSVRLARRAPARTASTGALVLVAVAVASVFLSVAWGDYVTDRDLDRRFGAADAIFWRGPGLPSDETRGATGAIVQAQPPGSVAAAVERTGPVVVTAGDLDATVTAASAPWTSPVLDGLLDLVDGSAPGGGQVVVPSDLAERAHLAVGDRIGLSGVDHPVEVSGIGAVGSWPDDTVALAEGELPVFGADGNSPTTLEVFVALPDGAVVPGTVDWAGDTVARDPVLRQLGGTSSSGFPPMPQPTPLRTLGGIVGLAGLVVAVTAGAAFGIGAARRRRTAGILAANGADGRDLRIATASEAFVVAMPAAVLGGVVGALVPTAWVARRWPLWSQLVDAAMPWPWVAGLVLVAVIASVLGALVAGRSLSVTSTSALLDERSAPRATRNARLGGWGFVLLGVVGLSAFQFLARLTAGSSLAVLAGMLLWVGVAAVAVAIGRAVLRRDVVGRLVASDLRRRPVGSVAAVVVVSAWVFVAIVATATDGFRFPSDDDGAVGTGPAAGVLIRSTDAAALPAGLADELARAGVHTTAASQHRWTGDCAVCPDGWEPSVVVLETADGTGLPADAVEALRSGAVVTGWAAAGDGSMAWMPVRHVPGLSVGADALVLRSSIGDGTQATGDDTQLVDPVPVLIGSTDGLDTAHLADVSSILVRPGITSTTWDPRLQNGISNAELTSGLGGLPDWVLVGLLVLLVLVTLAATAAHRREHGEAAWVLRVLGGGPREGRRLASTTAGTLATVGVALGLSAALLTLGGSAARQDGDDRFLGLWNRSASVVLVLALLVPVLVAGLARLLPTYRTAGDPRRLGPS